MSTSTTSGRRTFAIPCSVTGCRHWTSEDAPPTDWVTAQAAVRAAVVLGWIHARSSEGRTIWVCPRHQTYDPQRGRWIYDRGPSAPTLQDHR